MSKKENSILRCLNKHIIPINNVNKAYIVYRMKGGTISRKYFYKHIKVLSQKGIY